MALRKAALAAVLWCFWMTSVGIPVAHAENRPKYLWKIGTLAPRGVGYAVRFEELLLPVLEEATKGDLKFKIYFGGVMGDDEQHLKKMRVGQLQGAGLSGQGTFLIDPEIAILGLPFLFNDYNEVDYIKDKMLDDFDAVVGRQGLRLLLWLDQDFDQIYSSKVPIGRVEDFSRARFITWFGAVEGKFLERLGTQPVPMGIIEIPSSMRSGVADAMICPSIWVIGTQLYDTFRYMNPVKIRYVPGFAVCTTRAWNELPKNYDKALADKRRPTAASFNKAVRKDSEKCQKAIVQYGIKEVQCSPADMEALKARICPIWDELAGKVYRKALLDKIKGYLAEYRAHKK